MSVRLPHIPYYARTPADAAFYDEHLAGRLPGSIYDVHVHLNLHEHMKAVPRERILSDWALEVAQALSVDDAYAVAAELFPGIRYRIAGMPWPVREADLAGNNAYLASMRRAGRVDPFMVVMPDWDKDTVEQTLLGEGFVGFKPYPDMVSGTKGADISIFDYMPPALWELADRHRKAVMLHLPRRERLADDDNVAELEQVRERYPRCRVIVAHLGRSFTPYYLREGLRKLGDTTGMVFDLSGVMNPQVLDIAFRQIPAASLLWGSDMPVFLWHGTREWTERAYINLAREDFSWSRDRHRPPDVEARYTIFIYEQLRNILDAMDRAGLSDAQRREVFGGNARRVLGLPG